MNLSASTSSNIYQPLSTSVLASPPPLSSAGLSSRLGQSTSTSNSARNNSYRLSTLLPNTSGYLSFFGRSFSADLKPDSRSQKWRQRSSSLKSLFPSISAKLKRVRFNASFSAYKYESNRVLPPPVEYRKVEKYEENESETCEGSPSSLSMGRTRIEDDWKTEAKYLKEDFSCCLSGARCIGITDPVGDLTDELLQSTVVISSTDDPFPDLPPLPVLRARPRASANLGYSPNSATAQKPALESILASPPPELVLDDDDDNHVQRPIRIEVEDIGKDSGKKGVKKATLRISDCRSGTAAGSTKRVPTQKSVHPTFGRKRTAEDDRSRDSRISVVSSSSRLIVTNPDPDSESESDGEDDGPLCTPYSRSYSKPQTGADTAGSQESSATVTPTASDDFCSIRTIVNGQEGIPRRNSMSIAAPASSIRPNFLALNGHYSLVLDSDDYGYLLSLHSLSVRNGLSDDDVLRLHKHNRSVSFSQAIASSPVDAYTPCQSYGTPLESPTMIADIIQDVNDHLSCRPQQEHNHVHENAQGATDPHLRRTYREHLRRMYVSPYNDSPTPNTAWVIVRPPPEGTIAENRLGGGIQASDASAVDVSGRGQGKRGLVRGGKGRMFEKLKRGDWRRVKL
ncbi:hypothetical protein IAT40_001348 [Kwoniella sp. CBS 6097]